MWGFEDAGRGTKTGGGGVVKQERWGGGGGVKQFGKRDRRGVGDDNEGYEEPRVHIKDGVTSALRGWWSQT
jgi:hypothetical protein